MNVVPHTGSNSCRDTCEGEQENVSVSVVLPGCSGRLEGCSGTQSWRVAVRRGACHQT